MRIADGPDAGATATVDMGAIELSPAPFALVVTTADDELDVTPSAADLSLREAILLANGSLGADIITFASALAGQPILLSLGQLTINDPLTIQGRGAGLTIVDGGNASRLFNLTEAAGTVTFAGLTLTGGKATGGIQFGGAIQSNTGGHLRIQNSIVTGNSATSGGGGISVRNLLSVTNSTVSNNSTTGEFAYGGGISANGVVTIINSTISSNSTVGTSSKGSGIWSSGFIFTVSNSTISGNFTSGPDADGGGIYSQQSVTIHNSTITSNGVRGTNADGGGIASGNGPVAINNSIVAQNVDTQNQSHPDLQPGVSGAAVQYSLIGDNSGTGLTPVNDGSSSNKIGGGTDATRLNPGLAPRANNGGLTQTHALCTSFGVPQALCSFPSPALNAGSNALIPADTLDLDGDGDLGEPLPFDQRGAPFNRVVATTVDMGALESQPTFPWHNFAKPFDVNGGLNNQPDNFIVAGDALAIINYLNAFGAGPVPANAQVGLPFGFLDTSGGADGAGDNFITAGDALDVINFLNAGLGGEGEPEGSHGGTPRVYAADVQPVFPSSRVSLNELIVLLAIDVASQPRRRR